MLDSTLTSLGGSFNRLGDNQISKTLSIKTEQMDTNAVYWDSHYVYISDDFLAGLIDDDIETVAVLTPKGRYAFTTDDILDLSEWSDENTRFIPFSLIGKF